MKQCTLFFLVVLFMLQSCNHKEQVQQSVEDTFQVKTIPLQKVSVQEPIIATGQFTTEDETLLSFKTGGIITSVLVKEGDYIKKGQVIATINPTEINALTQQAALAVEKAQRDYDRVGRLYKDSVATQEQYQNTKTALDIAKEQLLTAKFNQDKTSLKAVNNGYVLRKLAFEGQVVGPGTPVLLTNGAGNNNWVLKAGVSDKEWASIQLGDKATVTTDVEPGRIVDAQIVKKSEGIDPSTGTFWVNLKIGGLKEKIGAGVFGKATVVPTKSMQAWAIPYDAVLDGDANEGYVFVTNNNQIALKKKIKIAGISNNQILVSEGLENIQSIIVSGSAYLNDSSRIHINQ
jgi:RND family efflux transporter MFP subunit